MFWLLLLIGFGFLVYYLATRKNEDVEVADLVEFRLMERNREWAQFIANYRGAAKTDSERELIDRMINDIAAQGLPVPAALPLTERQTTAKQPEPVAGMETTRSTVVPTIQRQQTTDAAQLDSVSLLLYFGAFLFVASVGLFVAFSGVSGGLKTLAVLLVASALYGVGVWLNESYKKFEQVGLTLAGISLAVTPLVGLAAYQYLFNQTYGSAIWLVTSALCLVQYLHAFLTFKKPLLSYLLIFTLLSLFESGVAVISVPIYYFGWMLAMLGIALTAINQWKGYWPEMRESSRASAQIFMPLSLLVSGVLITSQGVWQFGVSLLLAAVFYGLEAWRSEGPDRDANAIAAHVAVLGAIIAVTIGISHSWSAVAGVLLAVNILQAVVFMRPTQHTALWANGASVLVGSLLIGALASVERPSLLVLSVIVLIASTGAIWLKYHRDDMYVVAAVAWMVLPFIIGQHVMQNGLGGTAQTAAVLAAVCVQAGVYVWRHNVTTANWKNLAQRLLLLSAVLVVGMGFFLGLWASVVLIALTAALLTALTRFDGNTNWVLIAGIFVCVPVVRNWFGSDVLLAAILIALAYNAGSALLYRRELNRWIGTGLWLLVPVALGRVISGDGWTVAVYAWLYFVAMLGLIFSRAVARGVVLASSRVPLASYARSASVSYVVGYGIAAVLAVLLSLFSNSSQLHTTLMLSLLTVTIVAVGVHIEGRGDTIMLVPLLLQAVLCSGIRPVSGEASLAVFTCASTVLALSSYAVGAALGSSQDQAKRRIVQEGSLLAVFVAPAAVLFSVVVWTMPIGLLVAGGLTYYHVRLSTQRNRELSLAIMVAAVMWLMAYHGVREVQAYSHVLIATFAGYAYWRHRRSETAQSDQYLFAMLAVATVPLLIQALAGAAGGVYGWWLLLEQVAFMIIGAVIRKRFVVYWGLYVAVGSVLYQLRDLGWAALTVLALFVIGMASYQIQRTAKKD